MRANGRGRQAGSDQLSKPVAAGEHLVPHAFVPRFQGWKCCAADGERIAWRYDCRGFLRQTFGLSSSLN